MSDSVTAILDRARRFFGQELWSLDDLHQGSLKSRVMRALQLVVMIAQGAQKDQLLLRASALTYVTALSLIPLLAVALSIVRLFDPNNSLATIAVDYLAAGSPEAQDKILELVAGARLGGLGSVGAGILLVSTILALRHLEETLNSIWGVHSSRGWGRRFADYLALIIVVPLFLGIALSLGATITAGSTMGWFLTTFPWMQIFVDTGLRHAPKVFLLAGFSFIYWFFPNTKVRVGSALLGGALAAVCFSVAQQAYVGLNIGVAKYSALFGGFAALPLLLVWLYVCWAIILIGAEVSFAYQNLAHYRQEVRAHSMGAAEREIMGFCVALEVGRAFRDRAPISTAENLSTTLDVSVRSIREIIRRLEDRGILISCMDENDTEGYQLRRPAEQIGIEELRRAMRGARPALEGGELERVRGLVSGLVEEIENSIESVTGTKTLAQMLDAIPEATPQPSA